jgi:hypothetical protein
MPIVRNANFGNEAIRALKQADRVCMRAAFALQPGCGTNSAIET